MCLNHFARTHGYALIASRGKPEPARVRSAGKKVVLARPQTYMNLSGESVSRLVKKFNVNLDDLWSSMMTLTCPWVKSASVRAAAPAGTRALSLSSTELGSQDFIRIRIGIGRPTDS